MFDVVLYQPEIPPNTGNIIRLCANSGCTLHLVQPLGFDVSNKQLRRAGLDYHEQAVIRIHDHWDDCRDALHGHRWFALTTHVQRHHTEPVYSPGDVFLLGPETRGLPRDVLEEFPVEQRLRLPMMPGSRSINLSNAAAIMVYEAWRQCGFFGAV